MKAVIAAAVVFNALLLWNKDIYSSGRVDPALEFPRTQRLSVQSSKNNVSLDSLLIDAPECAPLKHLSPDQCTHVKSSCAQSDTLLSITYVQTYFCSSTLARPFIFTILVAWLAFLFSFIGLAASDFFVPNLATLATTFGLDDNVAGVTFLAFGNGSPDLFSTFSAMRSGSGSLAIGELLGAASFIVSVVVGSMCIVNPFKVNSAPFLRDVGFFTVSVALLLAILLDGILHAWEAIILAMLYVFYVLVVVTSTWWENRRGRKIQSLATARGAYEREPLPEISIYLDEPPFPDAEEIRDITPLLSSPADNRQRANSMPGTQTPGYQSPRPSSLEHSRFSSYPIPRSTSHHRLASFSLLGALEFRSVVTSLRRDSAAPILYAFESPKQLRFCWGSLSSPIPPSTPADSSRRVQPLQYSPKQITARESPRSLPSLEEALSSSSISAPLNVDTGAQISTKRSKTGRVLKFAGQIAHVVFPTLHRLRTKNVLGIMASILAAPAVLLLTISLPVVISHVPDESKPQELLREGRLIDFEPSESEGAILYEAQEGTQDGLAFNKWLTATQLTLGPLFVVAVCFGHQPYALWLELATLVASLSSAVLVLVFSVHGKHATARLALCLTGFAVSMVWIMAIADEVVQVLNTFGLIFGLSDAIIGLTIFAIGNSLADFVANFTVASYAPIMGFSACFGGPMLNILLGIGLSGSLVVSQTGRPYRVEFSKTLLVSSVGLLFLLMTTLAYVPWNGYYVDRRWGVFLICSYTAIMTVNILVEMAYV
ncbi:hypothetical protein BS47DRAFT_1311298 [Hydnum rufescens UP504]|uniref:Sodium/calcium exchanger membrane region domain-containing protein n=1 Tax=Hydnum rufescens UP504 TaxID=1448309 RepID=A0A9P6BAN4_9AGAM|nr:hypothetical protein BS47DRAFT_1311298 [Hydnum rufescens UP504]